MIPATATEIDAPDVPLRRNSAFVRLFAAGTVSYVGSFITRTALPLTAILVLGAGPLEIAALRSVEFIAWLLVGLVAGAWVDRLRRRPILVWTDLGRAVLLGSIPVAAVVGVLALPQLLVVAFGAAVLTVFFNTASAAYLPTIVRRERLVGANSALSASASAAEFTGFGLGGILVQVLTAPIAIAVDAVSFVVSAVLLLTIRRPEPPPPPHVDRRPVLREIREGIAVVSASPVLRALAAAHAMNHLMWGVFGTTYLLYATGDLGLGPAAIGIIAAIGGAGAFVGAAAAGRVAASLGVGGAMVVGLALSAVGAALIPLAPSGAVLVAAGFLIAQQLIGDAGGSLYEVLETSVTQALVDDRMLGRVRATVHFVTTFTALAGAVVAGLVAEALGLRGTLVLGVIGSAFAALVVWRSPARRLQAMADARPAPLDPGDVPVTE